MSRSQRRRALDLKACKMVADRAATWHTEWAGQEGPRILRLVVHNIRAVVGSESVQSQHHRGGGVARLRAQQLRRLLYG